MNSSRGKILVIRGGAIGDFILTLPAITALRNQFPQAQLEVLGYPHIVQLAQAAGLVDRVQSIEARALAGFFARNGILEPGLIEYFSGFHLIVSYLFDPDEVFRTNVARCTKAQFIAGPHRPNESEKIHATKVYLKPLERLAIFEADHPPQLKVGQASRLPSSRVSASENQGSAGFADAGRRDARPTLALHPGSGSETKNWPEKNWADLLQRLLDSTQLNFLLIGGEAEGERLQRLVAAMVGRVTPCAPLGVDTTLGAHGVTRPTNSDFSSAGRIRVAQSLPLVELAQQLQTCAAFVGHDSGISHLAAALGLPGLILWGETIEEIWRPPHEKIFVLKNLGGLKSISVEQVIQELERLLGK